MNSAEFQLALLAAVIAISAVLFLVGNAVEARRSRLPGLIAVGAIAGFVAIAWLDGAMVQYNDDALVRSAFVIPEAAPLAPMSHGKTPACWASQRAYQTTAKFAGDSWPRYTAGTAERGPALVAAVAGYLGAPPQAITLADGALAWRRADPRHSVDRAGKLWPAEHANYLRGTFLCLDLAVSPEAKGGYVATACDPLEEAASSGEVARVAAMHWDDARELRIEMLFARPPAQCENRARHAVNRMLGLVEVR